MHFIPTIYTKSNHTHEDIRTLKTSSSHLHQTAGAPNCRICCIFSGVTHSFVQLVTQQLLPNKYVCLTSGADRLNIELNVKGGKTFHTLEVPLIKQREAPDNFSVEASHRQERLLESVVAWEVWTVKF